MFRFVLDHQVNRGHRVRAMFRFAGWQAWKRIVRRPLTVNFWNALRVRVYPDWPYSSSAIYVRLIEYDEMTFTLRYLGPGDAFIDVGANIGVYSLLASSVNAGAPVVAIEPHPVACSRLRENASINSLGNIHVREAAAGSAVGSAMLTADLVDQNRIRTGSEGDARSIQVSIVTLDAELVELGIDPASVALVKVDTEGFEAEVLAGARQLLDRHPGPVWIIELIGLATRYGSDDGAVRAMFAERGYRPLRYLAATNRIIADDGAVGNVLFAREPQAVAARLAVGTSVSKSF